MFAAIPVGIVLGVATVIFISIGASAKPEGPLTLSDAIVDFGLGSLLYSLFMSVVALVPAGITAVIYRRFRR